MVRLFLKFRYIYLLFGLLAPSIDIVASQDRDSHKLNIGYSHTEYKDYTNYGFASVSDNLLIDYSYIFVRTQDYNMIYSSSIDFGVSTTGTAGGINAFLMPYEFSIEQNKSGWSVGTEHSLEYLIFLVPDLHMGHINWLTNFSFAPYVRYSSRSSKGFRAKLSAPLISFFSSRKSYEHYYFDVSFSGLMSDLHSNFQFALPYKLLDINLDIAYQLTDLVHFGSDIRYIYLDSNYDLNLFNMGIYMGFSF